MQSDTSSAANSPFEAADDIDETALADVMRSARLVPPSSRGRPLHCSYSAIWRFTSWSSFRAAPWVERCLKLTRKCTSDEYCTRS